MKDNGFTNYLGNKYGSGIASKADSTTGAHVLSQTVGDSYAKAGQVVPVPLQAAMRELNEIVAQEVQFRDLSADARSAMAGSGYDVNARRRRVAELEQQLITGSQEAAAAVGALENREAEARVVALEQANRFDAQVFDAKVASEKSRMMVAAATDQKTLQGFNDEKIVRAAMTSAFNTGRSLDELYEIWGSNDPALMKEAFGTSDRLIAHGVLTQMGMLEDESAARALKSMATATTLSAKQLAANPQMTTEMLAQMASGEIAAPEGVSMLAIGEALTERKNLETTRTALQAERLSGVKGEAELTQLAMGSLSTFEKAAMLGAALGGTAEDVLNAVDAGQFAEMEATMAGLPPIQFLDSSGAPVTVAPVQLLGAIAEGYEATKTQAATRLVTSSALERYQQEAKENTRVVKTAEAMLGTPVSSETRRQVDLYTRQATDFFTLAARSLDPAERGAYETQAREAYAAARKAVADEARRNGQPAFIVKDIEQGRFSSNESYKAALVDLVGYGEASTRNSPIGIALQTMLKEKGFTVQDIRDWGAKPDAGLDSIKTGWLGGSKGITPEDINKVMDVAIGSAITDSMLQALTSSPWISALGADTAGLLEPLITGSPDMTADEKARRLAYAAKIIDEAAATRFEGEYAAARASGKPLKAAPYSRGQIFRVMQDAVGNNAQLAAILAPDGIPNRAVAALLSEYNFNAAGTPRTGPVAVSLDDLVPATLSHIMRQRQMQMAGHAMADVGRVGVQANILTAQWLNGPGDYSAYAGLASSYSMDQYNLMLTEQGQAVRAATLAIMARRAASPSNVDEFFGALSFLGFDEAPEAAAIGARVTSSEIDGQLIAMGYDPAQMRAQLQAARDQKE